MGRPRGFVEIARVRAPRRSVEERLGDWAEFELPLPEPTLREQAARCMDCGIPFCHQGCPVSNLIPEWNDLVLAGRWDEASASLHATNNFPEVTGRVCPAPCEASCVLALDTVPDANDPVHRTAPGAVTIKQIERQIADHALGEGLVPGPCAPASGRKVAVVGSGPAGLAAAQQLARAGHAVTVFERDPRVGGLLRYGIPDFKLEKWVIDRRVAQMEAEGVVFRTGVTVGEDLPGERLRAEFDAVLLCGGAMVARALTVPGADLEGVHPAMDFLVQQNRRGAGDPVEGPEIVATGRHVVILGGGDTGSDCVGTSLRQGAASVTSFELMPRPGDRRAADNPWPAWPWVFRTSSSHEEGGTRDFGIETRALLGDAAGRVRALSCVRLDRVEGRLVARPGSAFEVPCDLVLLAMGFVGSRAEGVVSQLGLGLDGRGNVAAEGYAAKGAPGVFVAGDMRRGASLVVWAIAEGRAAAKAVDGWLRGG